jgi:hypothetical protein
LKQQARKLVTVCGVVGSARVKQGTGSEQLGCVLTTDDGEELLLQRIGGPAFGDESAKRFVGARVRVEGYRLAGTIRHVKIDLAS